MNILIEEDEKAQRTVFHYNLAAQGYIVMEADNGGDRLLSYIKVNQIWSC